MRNLTFRLCMLALLSIFLLAIVLRKRQSISFHFYPETFYPTVGQHILGDKHHKNKGPKAHDCSVDFNGLRVAKGRYGLGDKIQYARRYIQFTRRHGLERESMTVLDQSLFSRGIPTYNIKLESSNEVVSCEAPLKVDVPASGLPSTVNASDLMFGVSTTYSRFMNAVTDPVRDWQHWLTDGMGRSNGAKILITIVDATDAQLQDAAGRLVAAGINSDVYKGDSSYEMAVRYLFLVPLMATHPEAAARKWLVVCDDDTFFPSMHGLINQLGKKDHELMLYLGTLSEDVNAVERHGSQAFGGAGAILSKTLANKITDLFPECTAQDALNRANTNPSVQGDMLLRNCIHEHTPTRLTLMRDLWQLDIAEDASGFYEWGIKPLSLHHYRGPNGFWHSASPINMVRLTHICGEDCFLQRFRPADDFIFSSYSVAQYFGGINWDADQIEGTMRVTSYNKGWNFDYVFGPARPSLSGTGRKMAWRMVESWSEDGGVVVQRYVRKRDDVRWRGMDGRAMSEVDGVIDLAWIA